MDQDKQLRRVDDRHDRHEGSLASSRVGVREVIMVAACAAIFLFWISRYVNLGFYYDEIFTLRNYVFSPWKELVTNYSYPNNHVFFNLMEHAYFSVVGIKDLYSLMDSPWVARLLPVLYSVITCAFTYLIGRRFFREGSLGRMVGLLSLVLLVTTLPFYTWSASLRGYGLSMMLGCAIIYFSWRFEDEKGWVSGALIVLLSSLMVYTVPSNAYFVLSLAFGSALLALASSLKGRKASSTGFSLDSFKAWFKRMLHDPRTWVVFLLAGGAALSMILYLPILSSVLNNPFTKSRGFFFIPNLGLLPLAINYYSSFRQLLLVAALIGFALYARKLLSGKESQRIAVLSCILIVPFVLTFIRGDISFFRMFVYTLPPFVILFSAGLTLLIRGWPALGKRAFASVVIVLLVCCFTMAYGFREADDAIAGKIGQQHQYQDNLFEKAFRATGIGYFRTLSGLYIDNFMKDVPNDDMIYVYYHHHYDPMTSLGVLKGIYSEEKASLSPAALAAYSTDFEATKDYFKKFRLEPYLTLSSEEEVMAFIRDSSTGGALIVTPMPNLVISMVHASCEGYSAIIPKDFLEGVGLDHFTPVLVKRTGGEGGVCSLERLKSYLNEYSLR